MLKFLKTLVDSKLTADQILIATRVTQGISNADIAIEMEVSEAQIYHETHIIYLKMGLKSRAQLIVYFVATEYVYA